MWKVSHPEYGRASSNSIMLSNGPESATWTASRQSRGWHLFPCAECGYAYVFKELGFDSPSAGSAGSGNSRCYYSPWVAVRYGLGAPFLYEGEYMDKDELLAFLRENLTIELETSEDNWNDNVDIKVTLFLDGEPISKTRDSFRLPQPRSCSCDLGE